MSDKDADREIPLEDGEEAEPSESTESMPDPGKSAADSEEAVTDAVDASIRRAETVGSGDSAESPEKRKAASKKAVICAAVVIVLVVALGGANAAGLFHQHTWKEATCTTAKTCEECGATEGNPQGHDYEVTEKEATCTLPGKKVYTCKRCGDSYSEDNGEPAKGHTPGEWRVDTASMKSVQYCSTCGLPMASEELTRDALEQAMSTQDFTLDDIYKVDSGSGYKYIYKDQIGLDVTNHTDKIVRSADVLVCAYDGSGLPVSVDLSFYRGHDVVSLSLDDVNLAAGASWSSRSSNWGWDINGDSTDKMIQFRGCVSEVTFTDSTSWSNPYATAWMSLYSGKSL